MNRNGQPLPCKLDELGNDSTSLDPYAYIALGYSRQLYSHHPKRRVLRHDQTDDRYYTVSRNNSEIKYLFEIKNRPQKLSYKPSDVYPTTYESLFVAISYRGVDMKTGRNLIQQNDKGPVMPCYPHDQEKYDPGHSNLYVVGKYNTAPHGGTWLNMDHEFQQGTKLDYLFLEKIRSTQSFRTSSTGKSV